MAELNDTLKKVLKDCGLGHDAVWKHKQSGKWIVYHWACEAAGAAKGIAFDPPTIIDANAEKKLAVIVVTGRVGDRVEWSFGEAAPYNTTQTYPFAMAEKRAKDRVILKLIGLHGVAYSEEEADSFKSTPGQGRDAADGDQNPAGQSQGADSSGQQKPPIIVYDVDGQEVPFKRSKSGVLDAVAFIEREVGNVDINAGARLWEANADVFHKLAATQGVGELKQAEGAQSVADRVHALNQAFAEYLNNAA